MEGWRTRFTGQRLADAVLPWAVQEAPLKLMRAKLMQGHLSERIAKVCLPNAIPIGERQMAERKSALKLAPERPNLKRLLEHAKTVVVTDEMLLEQRASFVYGNAPQGSRITKESARESVKHVRITPFHA